MPKATREAPVFPVDHAHALLTASRWWGGSLAGTTCWRGSTCSPQIPTMPPSRCCARPALLVGHSVVAGWHRRATSPLHRAPAVVLVGGGCQGGRLARISWWHCCGQMPGGTSTTKGMAGGSACCGSSRTALCLNVSSPSLVVGWLGSGGTRRHHARCSALQKVEQS